MFFQNEKWICREKWSQKWGKTSETGGQHNASNKNNYIFFKKRMFWNLKIWIFVEELCEASTIAVILILYRSWNGWFWKRKTLYLYIVVYQTTGTRLIYIDKPLQKYNCFRVFPRFAPTMFADCLTIVNRLKIKSEWN